MDQNAPEPKDVAGTVQVDAVLAGQGLDRLELADVPLRKPPAGGRGGRGDHHSEMLIHHQGARVRLQDLGRDADRVDGLVEREARLRRRPAGYSFSQSSIPSE